SYQVALLLGIVWTIRFRVLCPTTPFALRPWCRWNVRTELSVGWSKVLSRGTRYALAFRSQWRVLTSPPQSPTLSALAPKRSFLGQDPEVPVPPARVLIPPPPACALAAAAT